MMTSRSNNSNNNNNNVGRVVHLQRSQNEGNNNNNNNNADVEGGLTSTTTATSPVNRKGAFHHHHNTAMTQLPSAPGVFVAAVNSPTSPRKRKVATSSSFSSLVVVPSNTATIMLLLASMLVLGWTWNMFYMIRWTSTSQISNVHILGDAELLLERMLHVGNGTGSSANNIAAVFLGYNNNNKTQQPAHASFSLNFWKEKEAPFLAALHKLRKELKVPTLAPTSLDEEDEEEEGAYKYIPPDKVFLPKFKGKKAKAALAAADNNNEENDEQQGDDEALDREQTEDEIVNVTKIYIPPHSTNPKGEMKHIVLDGIQNSRYLDFTDDPDDDEALWVVDLNQIDCNVLYHELEAAMERRERRRRLMHPDADHTVIIRSKQEIQLPTRENNLQMNPPSPLQPYAPTLIIMDFFDYGSMYFGEGFYCFESFVPLVGREHIRLATRQFLNGRNITHEGRKDTDLFWTKGRVDVATDTYWKTTFYSRERKILRYGVRSDLYMVLNQVLVKYHSHHATFDNVDMETVSLGPEDSRWNDTERYEQEAAKIDLIQLPRPMDVVHFWKTGDDKEYASHRDVVNAALQRIPAQRPSQTFTIFTDTLGNRDKSGRNSAQVEYAWALLQCKIFIACQRDHWEDHYRLMEGLISGALVMTDPMHPLPLHLENGKNLIVFDSLAQLQELVLYYLDHPQERMEIARRGRDVALKYHRSWHIMERIILGNWSSPHY